MTHKQTNFKLAQPILEISKTIDDSFIQTLGTNLAEYYDFCQIMEAKKPVLYYITDQKYHVLLQTKNIMFCCRR